VRGDGPQPRGRRDGGDEEREEGHRELGAPVLTMGDDDERGKGDGTSSLAQPL
jgi:hypothetical protein